MSATIGDIYEVNFNLAQPGGVAQNNFGFECVTNVAGDAQANLGAAFQTALVKNTSGGLLYGVSSQFSSTNLHVQDVKPGSLATYIRTYSTVSGSNLTDPLPPQDAVCYSLRTALKGRSYRGRFYLAGVPKENTAGGTLTAGAITVYTTILTQLLAVFGPAGSNGDWRLCVISRYHNGIKRPSPVSTQVTSGSMDSVIRTQRRRVSGVGS